MKTATMITKQFGVEKKHCKPRIEERFGIKGEDAQKAWVNEKLKDSVKIGGPDERGRSEYIHFVEPIRIVINENQNVAITVINEFACNTKMNSEYLDSAVLAMLRERRKLETAYTRTRRYLDLKRAEAHVESGRLMMNRARAKNPGTQKHIQTLVEAQQERAAEYEAELEKEKELYVIAKVKIESFLRTTNPKIEGGN